MAPRALGSGPDAPVGDTADLPRALPKARSAPPERGWRRPPARGSAGTTTVIVAIGLPGPSGSATARLANGLPENGLPEIVPVASDGIGDRVGIGAATVARGADRT